MSSKQDHVLCPCVLDLSFQPSCPGLAKYIRARRKVKSCSGSQTTHPSTAYHWIRRRPQGIVASFDCIFSVSESAQRCPPILHEDHQFIINESALMGPQYSWLSACVKVTRLDWNTVSTPGPSDRHNVSRWAIDTLFGSRAQHRARYCVVSHLWILMPHCNCVKRLHPPVFHFAAPMCHFDAAPGPPPTLFLSFSSRV